MAIYLTDGQHQKAHNHLDLALIGVLATLIIIIVSNGNVNNNKPKLIRQYQTLSGIAKYLTSLNATDALALHAIVQSTKTNSSAVDGLAVVKNAETVKVPTGKISLVMLSAGDRKAAVMRVIRQYMPVSLPDVLGIINAAQVQPQYLLRSAFPDKAEEFRVALTSAGATIITDKELEVKTLPKRYVTYDLPQAEE